MLHSLLIAFIVKQSENLISKMYYSVYMIVLVLSRLQAITVFLLTVSQNNIETLVVAP
jgi:hypothetical protein